MLYLPFDGKARRVSSDGNAARCRSPSSRIALSEPSGALARRSRARFCSRRARIAVAQGAQRAQSSRIRRMSVNENVPQQRWAAQQQGGSDGDTRLARRYIIYDGWCNRARRGADSTVVVAPTGATRGSGPRQYAAGTLLLSVHDRSWLSSCRAKSARSVSRSKARTTEQFRLMSAKLQGVRPQGRAGPRRDGAPLYGTGTTVPDWRDRLICSGCGGPPVDSVVTGTGRR
jgi:hypothetical protein